MTDVGATARAGALLRDWRHRRRLSQLDLALEAGVSARHLSFVARTPISRGPVLAVIAVNALWVVASLALAVSGWGSPESAGTVWVVLQALVVAAFAELQAVTRPRA